MYVQIALGSLIVFSVYRSRNELLVPESSRFFQYYYLDPSWENKELPTQEFEENSLKFDGPYKVSGLLINQVV